jgi:predicted N-acetyltransferase YhbS
MSSPVIEPASPADDDAIRALLRASTVPGEVALSFQREPSYLAGEALAGRAPLTLVARAEGCVVAVASAAVRDVYLGGRPCEVGYVGQLRVARAFEGRALVPRGLRALRDHLAQRGLDGAFATISSGNRGAERVLLDRPARRGDGFVPIADLHTLTFAATRTRGRSIPAGIRRATHGDLDEVLGFLARHGAKRNLFPVAAAGDLLGDLPGLSLDDVLLDASDGCVRGVMAVWDQHAVRQTVVRGYGRRLTALKPLLDVGRVLRGARRLPAVGSALRVSYASLTCVENDDPFVATRLVHAAVRSAARHGAHALALTLASTDPLLHAVRRLRHVDYGSRLVVLPLADDAFATRVAKEVPFVDAGRL